MRSVFANAAMLVTAAIAGGALACQSPKMMAVAAVVAIVAGLTCSSKNT